MRLSQLLRFLRGQRLELRLVFFICGGRNDCWHLRLRFGYNRQEFHKAIDYK